MVRRANFKDRIITAFRTRDETALVSELGKIEDMLGEVVSDALAGTEGASTVHAGGEPGEHHITVNVHAPGRDAVEPGAEGSAVSTSGSGSGLEPMGEEGSEGGGDLASRVEALEQAVAMLCQEQGGEGGEQGAEGGEFGGSGAPEEDAVGEGAEGEWPAGDPGEVEQGGGMDGLRTEGYGPRVPRLGRDGRRRTRDEEAEEERKAREEKERRERTGDRRGTRTGDGRRASVGDSTSMRANFVDMISRAEILVPGIRFPTFDAARPARMTADTMCNFRRAALVQAWRTGEGRDAIEPLLGNRRADFGNMTCDAVSGVFQGASEVLRRENDRSGERGRSVVNRGGVDNGGKVMNPASINAANRKKYGLA